MYRTKYKQKKKINIVSKCNKSTIQSSRCSFITLLSSANFQKGKTCLSERKIVVMVVVASHLDASHDKEDTCRGTIESPTRILPGQHTQEKFIRTGQSSQQNGRAIDVSFSSSLRKKKKKITASIPRFPGTRSGSFFLTSKDWEF